MVPGLIDVPQPPTVGLSDSCQPKVKPSPCLCALKLTNLNF